MQAYGCQTVSMCDPEQVIEPLPAITSPYNANTELLRDIQITNCMQKFLPHVPALG